MERIGEKIKALRDAATPPLSQEDLAKAAGVSQTTIADLERGRNETSRRLVDIARALDITSEELTNLPSAKLIGLTKSRTGSPSHNETELNAQFLTRKTAEPKHNTGAAKALFDLAQELERGELPEEVHAMLLSELETKRRIVHDLLTRMNKGKPKR